MAVVMTRRGAVPKHSFSSHISVTRDTMRFWHFDVFTVTEQLMAVREAFPSHISANGNNMPFRHSNISLWRSGYLS